MRFSLMRPGDLLVQKDWSSSVYALTASDGKTLRWVCLDTGKPLDTPWSKEQDEIEPEYVVVRGPEELP